MTIRKLLLIVVALGAMACGRGVHCPIDASNATLISEPENLMSHCASTIITEEGEVWCAYYRDLVGNVEDPVNTTIEIVLSRFNIADWQTPQITHTRLFKAGDRLGDFTQGDYAAYDPVLFDGDGAMRCIIQAFEGGESCLAAFDIDHTSGTPLDKMMRCTLTYPTENGNKTVPLKASALRHFYEQQGVVEFENYERPLIDKKFIRHGDWYYNVLCNWYCKEAKPAIIRTKNGIDYEVVFVCPEFEYGCTEGSIAIDDERLYLIGRSRSPRRGAFLGCYSLSGDCLTLPYQVGDDGSRPEMILYKGRIYAMYNILPLLSNEQGKEIYRSRVRLAELDKEGKILHHWDYEAPHSMQYFCLNQYGDGVYLTFTEDRFGRADKEKGNIAFVKSGL